jgi:hypothetical protein
MYCLAGWGAPGESRVFRPSQNVALRLGPLKRPQAAFS